MHRATVIFKKHGKHEMNYNDSVSAVYQILAAGNENLASDLHNATSKFKPFTYAKQEISGSMSIMFSSVQPEITAAFLSGAESLKGTGLIFGDTIYEIQDFIPIADIRLWEEKIKVKTVSPLVLSRCNNGKKEYILYRKGEEDIWLKALQRNIAKRMLAFTGKEIEPENIRTLNHGQAVLVSYQGGKVPARHISLEIKGCPDVLKTAVYGGIGERTGSGFGMVFPV